jgi:O-phosphoseryl-tRNA(Cys) synthetase
MFFETEEFGEILALYHSGEMDKDDLKRHVAHMADVYGLPRLPERYYADIV